MRGELECFEIDCSNECTAIFDCHAVDLGQIVNKDDEVIGGVTFSQKSAVLMAISPYIQTYPPNMAHPTEVGALGFDMNPKISFSRSGCANVARRRMKRGRTGAKKATPKLFTVEWRR